MEVITGQLEASSEKALKSLLSNAIVDIRCSCVSLTYMSPVITCSFMSIRLSNNKFLTLEFDWGDTQVGRNDVYYLEAELTETPSVVQAEISEDGKSWNYRSDYFSYDLGYREKACAVKILSETYEDEINNERISYDAGLVVSFESGKELAIVHQDSIMAGLKFSSLPEVNSELVEPYVVRKTLLK
ncbi:hypothetical protein F0266_25685 [Vibrio coralliilyticus]|uniref:hypothetical protein n=1 Tax=Vibrio coralliilyticus TaxID=190893 RepID=UPI00148C1F95|nr:hypothetical protein [Vibrio coralliilyticus]NOH56304.1 hypothetical protein [Vibrio coralliilyticus]